MQPSNFRTLKRPHKLICAGLEKQHITGFNLLKLMRIIAGSSEQVVPPLLYT